jgi:mono/diheme cytochrome c family protein
MSLALWLLLLSPALWLGAGWALGADDPPTPSDQTAYAQQVRPLLQQFCFTCHGGQKPSGGVNLTAFPDLASVRRDPTTWRKVLTQLRAGTMPPKSMPQPTDMQRGHLLGWLDQALNAPADNRTPNDPGRVLIHRLSRTEYNNTVRDLLGVHSHPADTFPADGGGGGGFDNNADTLFIPPILMERYLAAASQVLAEARPERLYPVRPGKGLSRQEAARKDLTAFTTRAYRHPVETTDVDGLMRLFDRAAGHGASFENAVKFALKAVLIAPDFLFRVEPDCNSLKPYRISDYELASRLSYFLWSSMPDATLFRLAGQQRLHDPKVLEQQVGRMLQDPKAYALADSFAGQWLRVRDLYTTAQPDPGRFPNYTPSLRDAMYKETISFFASLLHDNASLLGMLDADYTYLNEELARHYGIEGVAGPQMRRVSLMDRRRGGVLTMASVLTLTSFPQRTSPVLRGKWVLSEILGAPPAPPPPDAGGLPADDAPTKEGLTFRQRLEKHRERPQCASCHARMDPIGFGLENYDAIGRWRTEVGGKPVDASGVFTDGTKFNGPAELKQYLLQQKTDFIRNLTEEMLAYALGRGLEPYDTPTVRKITQAVAQDGYHSSTLILEIVKSYPFQYRRNL